MNSNKSLKFRHELKHNINFSDYLILCSRLRVVARLDDHVGDEGTYRIRSLYFDNLHDKVLREKIDGINNREKFRIRYYNDNFTYIRLEKKSKINGLCLKQSAVLSKEECEKLIEGDLDWMTSRGDPLILELYSKMKFQQLKPRVIVDYVREPYVFKAGNVRVTIDTRIQTGLVSNDLFNQELPTVDAGTDKDMILEVKYDEFLPDIIKDIVQLKGRRSSAFSKYAACRIYG